MKKYILLFFVVFFIVFIFNFVSTDFVDDGSAIQNVTSCGVLNTSNATYILNQSLNSSYDCITINATNITLDCKGYNINFGNATGGFGIIVSGDGGETGHDNITIQNCVIVQNESGGDYAGIRFGPNSENGVVYNNTLLIYGIDTVGIMLEDFSINANISLNDITCSGRESTAITLSANGTGVDIRNNVVTTSGNDSSGILIGDNSTDGTIFNNTITTMGNFSFADNSAFGAIFLDVGTARINVSSNNITTSGIGGEGVWIWSSSNHSIDDNTIVTSGEQGDGIYVVDILVGG